jgi:type IV secretion system protein VirB8
MELSMQPITPEEERLYFAKALTWDDDRVLKAEASEKRAWTVARLQWIVMILLVALALVLALSRKVYPFLVTQRADNTVQVTNLLTDPQLTYQEALNQFFLRKATAARENFNLTQAQRLFDESQLFNSPEQQKIYKAQSDPANPQSMSALFGNRAEVTLRENSPPVTTSFDKKTGISIATYRWQQHITPKDGTLAPKPINWMSTITYTYVGTPASPAVRAINPLGMQILDYRKDPDQGGALQ